MAEFDFAHSQPPWGPGRLDAFTPIRTNTKILHLDPLRGTIGTTDIPPAWKLDPTHARHWDGNITDLTESILSATLAVGVSREAVTDNLPNLERIKNHLMKKSPPVYPFPIHDTLVPEGKKVFNTHCAECHNVEGKRTGTVIPQQEIRTDHYRSEAWKQDAADKYNTDFTKGYPWQFHHFRGYPETNGYVAVPLDGIWLRAPYLHNGSVPSLRDLLNAPADRPKKFYRGYDVYDPEKVGFIYDVPEESGRKFFEFNTEEPGNGNEGHLWGTDNLPPKDKEALLEYLKTL